MEKLRQTMLFFRYLGLILADKANLGSAVQKQLLRDYLRLKLTLLLPSSYVRSVKQISFQNHSLTIFDLKTTVSLIESIFIENEYYFFSQNLKPVILDLGSNIGLSIIYLKTLYPKCSITAYEADPETFKALKKNVKEFGYKHVQLRNLAVTDITGEISFYIDKQGPGSPLMSTNPLRLTKDSISIKSVKLSSVLKKEVDFVKMDIEGSELSVLKNLDSTGKVSLIDQMSIEYHHHINTEKDLLSHLLHILEKHNFGYQIHASQNTPFSIKTFEDIQIHAYKK